MNFTFAPLGSISSGTLNTRQLLDVFMHTLMRLARLDDNVERAKRVKTACANAQDLLVIENWTEDQDEEAADMVGDVLPNLLQGYALPFVTFGSHSGDGSDFGFWVDDEAIEQAVKDQEIARVVTLTTTVDLTIPYKLLVQGHGRMTLISHSCGIQIWTA